VVNIYSNDLWLGVCIGVSPGRTGWLIERCVQVLPDGIVMDACSHCNKEMPYSVSKGHYSITFKEHNAQNITPATNQQLTQT